MRIRKHAQRSQALCLPSSELPSPNPRRSWSPSTRVCELNRSPWDVMSFTSEAMRDDGFSGNESGGETFGAVESNKGTWEEDDDGKLNLEGRNISDISWSSSSPTVAISVSGRERRRKEGSFICCNKTDGKGWKCKKEAKRGHSLCEHHLLQLKSYYTNNKSGNNRSSFLSGRGGKSVEAHPSAAAAHNGYRGKKSSSKTSSSNYYYYTGFGPLWGKGRGEDKKKDMEVDSGPSSSTTPSLSSRGDGGGDDDYDDDDDDTEDDDDGKVDKKRARKPVKTRSLKSLL
ncbi:uncharacterized protein LOC122060026 [Macadamia integrifolia]|uniref:uncharacterized protein LOC122060026 n=1 Tax=Macadamia integrifolia TaxID=60698 RepID=UPI001C530B5B|nr:uncharacterized protein LOC122060026 [Macadamia integrifolia]